jgi:predicted signal transduction protein with EAL and GGDEF domain
MVGETPKAVFGLVILSSMIAWVYWSVVPENFMMLWIFLQTIFISLRYYNAKKLGEYLKAQNPPKVLLHTKFFFVLIIYSAIVWNMMLLGSAVLLSTPYEFISVALVMGIITAGVVSLSSLYKAFFIYFILMILPQAFVMYMYGNHEHIAILLFLLVYIPSILILSKSVRNNIFNNIKAHELMKLDINEYHQQSITDPLTGVYNRRYFFQTSKDILNISERDGKAVSLLMMDIDHFKKNQ